MSIQPTPLEPPEEAFTRLLMDEKSIKLPASILGKNVMDSCIVLHKADYN